MTTNGNTFPDHPHATNATKLGEHYYRLMTAGVAIIGYTKKDGRYGAMGQDHIDAAANSLADLDNAAAVFATLDLAQARELFAALHNQTRNNLAGLIHDAVHNDRPDRYEPCDDPDCCYAGLTLEERNARSALDWIADILDAGAQPATPTPPPTPRVRQGLSRALKEIVASGHFPHITEHLLELQADSPPGSLSKTAAEPTESGGPGTPAKPFVRAQPDDEFGTHMPQYQRGRAWAKAILGAVHTTVPAAHSHLQEADRLLGPLGNITDPEELRDFIASAARQAEDDLTPPF